MISIIMAPGERASPHLSFIPSPRAGVMERPKGDDRLKFFLAPSAVLVGFPGDGVLLLRGECFFEPTGCLFRRRAGITFRLRGEGFPERVSPESGAGR